ncbi:MAG: hypothetical protein P8L41_05790 [Paracoccaceae bacterium]|nr:hypothetical protein [Paracoccaceae bacterium]
MRSSTLSALWIGIALFGLVLIIGKTLYMHRFAEPATKGNY